MTRLADGAFAGSTADGATLTGATAYDTATPLEGDASLACNASGEYAHATFAGVADQTYYGRVLFRFSALPGAAMEILGFYSGNLFPAGAVVTLGTNGKLSLGSIATGTTVLQAGVIYAIELSCRRNTALNRMEHELRIDGMTEVAGNQAFDVRTPDRLKFGAVSVGGSSGTVTADDWAINDGQGAAPDNTWPYVAPDTDAPVITSVAILTADPTADRNVEIMVELDEEADLEDFQLKVYGDVDGSVNPNIQPLEANAVWFTPGGWEFPPPSLTDPLPVTLSEAEGLKTVRVKVRDEALNVSAEATDTIEYAIPASGPLRLGGFPPRIV